MSKKKKEPEQQSKSYIVGPFKEAMDNIDNFAINMYYSYYYDDAVQNLIKTEERIEENMTIEDAEKRQEDLEFYQQVLDLVADLKINPNDEEFQS
tara:strand:- start:41 stop:325 length:285 start_codon:yes stop_codon:yes gene_type:complete